MFSLNNMTIIIATVVFATLTIIGIFLGMAINQSVTRQLLRRDVLRELSKQTEDAGYTCLAHSPEAIEQIMMGPPRTSRVRQLGNAMFRRGPVFTGTPQRYGSPAAAVAVNAITRSAPTFAPPPASGPSASDAARRYDAAAEVAVSILKEYRRTRDQRA